MKGRGTPTDGRARKRAIGHLKLKPYQPGHHGSWTINSWNPEDVHAQRALLLRKRAQLRLLHTITIAGIIHREILNKRAMIPMKIL